MVKQLKRYLRSYLQEHRDEWDQHLTAAEIAINNSVQASTGYTPFFLESGRHPHLPLNTAMRDAGLCNIPAAARTIEQFHEDIEKAKQHLRRAQQSQKEFADMRRVHVQYQVGDRVFLRLPQSDRQRSSITNKYVGPLDVIGVPSPVTVKLALPQNTHQSTHDTFHVDRIKKYQPAEPELFPNRVQNLRPDPDIIDGVEMYEVEDILAERRVRKRGRISLQYLVKWKGYSSAEASWEYAISLRRAAEVVRRYKARKQQEQEEDEIHQDEEEGPQPDTNSED
jgi:hypothetical protein